MSQTSDEQPAVRQTPERRGDRWRADRWRQAAQSIGLSPRAVRRARLQLLVFAPLFSGVILMWDYRHELFGLPTTSCLTTTTHHCPSSAGTTALQVFVVLALVIVGWVLARDFGRGLEPILFKRMDTATAGTAGFVIRLLTVLAAIVFALRIAGVPIAAIAIGASFSAVVFGLAAQQTLGNLIAGIVLLTARPFLVGDRVRLQGGGGIIEGVVASLGLLYTTFNAGDDPVLVPNSLVLAGSVSPLREPDAVRLTVRLRSGTTPIELQRRIEQALSVPIRRPPSVTLEELDGAEMVVTVSATPRVAADGGALAAELLDVLTREVAQREAGEAGAARTSEVGQERTT